MQDCFWIQMLSVDLSNYFLFFNFLNDACPFIWMEKGFPKNKRMEKREVDRWLLTHLALCRWSYLEHC